MTSNDAISGLNRVSKIYWIGLFAASLVVNYFLGFLTQVSLTNANPAVQIGLGWIETGVLCAFTIYLGIMLRALWRAAHDHRTPGFWGWTAICIAVVALLQTGYASLSVLSPAFPVPPFIAKLEFRELNKQLPLQIEDGFVLRRAHVRDRTIVHVFQLSEKIEEADKFFWESSLTLDFEGNMETCRAMQGYFRGGMVGLEFQYSYPMGSVRAFMPAAECLERISKE
ncbi:hypothetical protein [Tritonibacter mobilis]|uniref:hypothetical protein n=1 Tax=Tritonibacter mobilis TaxID=379347 RepID=UPI003A5BF545